MYWTEPRSVCSGSVATPTLLGSYGLGFVVKHSLKGVPSMYSPLKQKHVVYRRGGVSAVTEQSVCVHSMLHMVINNHLRVAELLVSSVRHGCFCVLPRRMQDASGLPQTVCAENSVQRSKPLYMATTEERSRHGSPATARPECCMPGEGLMQHGLNLVC